MERKRPKESIVDQAEKVAKDAAAADTTITRMLTLRERFTLAQVVAGGSGDVKYINSIERLIGRFNPSDVEAALWGVERDGGQVKWPDDSATGTDMSFTPREFTCVADQMLRMNKEGAITLGMRSLMQKFLSRDDLPELYETEEGTDQEAVTDTAADLELDNSAPL